MKKVGTVQMAIDTLARLRVGGAFIDHRRNVVERVSETQVRLGVGYNYVLPVAGYIDAIRAERTYGRYLLPE